jgi:V/A-type H+-transporting ATPase subunit I
MRWRESLVPARMERVALVAPAHSMGDALRVLASRAVVELELPDPSGDGQDELDRAVGAAIVSGPVSGLVGWAPAHRLPELTQDLAPLGCAIVRLSYPPGVQPPTLLSRDGASSTSRLLVDTYGTVPYADLDPARLAGLTYVIMFGMMFGDVGHGALLLLSGLILRSGRIRRLHKLQNVWQFVVGAGLTSMFFGVLYGTAFGPTGLVPVVWLDPLTEPVPLLLAALLFGSALLGVAYALGTVNRFREGGWGVALYSRTGVAGSLLFLSLALLALGLYTGTGWVLSVAAVLATVALTFLSIGLYLESGGGAAGVAQAAIELFDIVIRLGSNIVSFARLAAFGLTHAALLMVVWNGTTALWVSGWYAAAIVVFVIGNIVTFGLEALVAGIQALRLEYYELFSRIFATEGRPFLPWAPVLTPTPEPTASSDSAPERQQP